MSEITLALTPKFSEDDFDLAFATLKRQKMIPENADKTYFTDGGKTEVNFSVFAEEQGFEMCMAFMAAIIAKKEE